MSHTLPRPIAPKLVEIGDTVRVVYRKDKGVTLSFEGTVARRKDFGELRMTLTKEGGRIFVWGAQRTIKYKVILLSRAPAEQTPLFDTMDEIRERDA